jgi:hypothetical protein
MLSCAIVSTVRSVAALFFTSFKPSQFDYVGSSIVMSLGFATFPLFKLIWSKPLWTDYEKRASVLIGFASGIVAFSILLLPYQWTVLDVQLERGLADFAKNSQVFMGILGIKGANSSSTGSNGNASNEDTVSSNVLGVSFLLSLVAGSFTTLIVLPCFRYARCYNLRLESRDVGTFKRVLLHLNFFLPLFVSLLWIKPLTSDLLLPVDLVKCSGEALDRTVVSTMTEAWPTLVLKISS